MYGLVNKAIRDLIVEKFGEDKWLIISEKAGLSDPKFLPLQTYPDEVTYNLVGSASEVLGLSPEEVLKAFGEYWVLFTAREGYGPVMDLFGSNLRSCLHNLNNLHARMGALLPSLKPPRFVVKEDASGDLTIEYYSKRKGLGPMVVGLLSGLALKHKENVKVTALARVESDTCDRFEIQFLAKGA